MKERPLYPLPGHPMPHEVWNPQEPRTPLERAWNRLPNLVRDYLELGYMLKNPELTKEERKELSQKRFEAFCIIEENGLLSSLTDFIQLRDKDKRKK